jgi:hypothetical protein
VEQSYTFQKLLPYFKKARLTNSPNKAVRMDNSTVYQDLSAFNNALNGSIEDGLPNYTAFAVNIDTNTKLTTSAKFAQDAMTSYQTNAFAKWWSNINITIGEKFSSGLEVKTDEQIEEFIRGTVRLFGMLAVRVRWVKMGMAWRLWIVRLG